MWKVQKVPFLGVVMGEGKVEMEEDKVEGVLKCVTNFIRTYLHE